MKSNEIKLRITDEEELPEGFMPLIRFSINDKLELHSSFDKRIDKDLIIDALKQWISSHKKR